MENTILHIDMNNFYASVETLYQPELKNVPMAVAGDKENRHGIILAKNMLAKNCGVKTAEAIWQAQKKCPNLVFVKPHFDRYKKYSELAKEIYYDYTDRIESFGLDECWLDIGGSEKLFGSGEQIAQTIRERVKSELGLTVSIGVSFNKIFAKLGSDYKKPDAVTVFDRSNFKEIVWKLSAEELLYVGSSVKKTLNKYGIYTIGDIAKTDRGLMQKILGKAGGMLSVFARGEDNTPVTQIDKQERVKTIGNSTTLPRDITKDEDVKKVFMSLAETVTGRVRKLGLKYGEVQITVKYSNFEEYQRQCTVESSSNGMTTLYETAMKLYKMENRKNSIRLLGIRAGKLSDSEDKQISFFVDERKKEGAERLEKALDDVRNRYGSAIITRALLCNEKDLLGDDGKDEKSFP